MRTVTSALFGALIVGFVCFYARATPDRVGCNLIGDSGLNVMNRTKIMDVDVEDKYKLINRTKLQLISNGTRVEINLIIYFENVMNSGRFGAVIHTTFGRLKGLHMFTHKNCTVFNSSVHYAEKGKLHGNKEVVLEAPLNSPPIYVSVLVAEGYGKVYRDQQIVYAGADQLTSLETTSTNYPVKHIPETTSTNYPVKHIPLATNANSDNIETTTTAASIGVDVSGDISNSLTDVEVIYHECSDVDQSIKNCVEERGPWKWTCFDEALVDVHPCEGGRILNKDGVCVEPQC